MERLPTLYQDEFMIEVRSCSEITCPNPSPSSEGTTNFSFCAPLVPPPHLHGRRCAYADEIFQNGKIRPLHSQPSQAITLYEHLPHVETINVHEASYTSSAPHDTASTLHYHEPARARASLSHTHHHHSHHTSPPHTHFNELSRATPHPHTSHTHAANHHHPHYTPAPPTLEPARATTHPHHHPLHQPPQTFESSARATLNTSVAAKCKRALSLFPLRRVFHVNEDESSSPPNREPFTPTKLKDETLLKSHSSTHFSNMKKLQSSFLTTKGARSQSNSSYVRDKHLASQGNKSIPRKLKLEEAPLNIPPRVNKFVHTSSSPPSPHAVHYNARRAHKESMKKRTSLPYHHGFLACIGY